MKDCVYNRRIILDGIHIKVEKPDIDGDGVVGGTEVVTQRMGSEDMVEIKQPTELGESLKELNKDEIDTKSNMSSMDMLGRLGGLEIGSILALDTLISMRFLPAKTINITRQKKRLSVSLDGKGRGEIVDIVAGKRENDLNKAGGGMMDRLKGMFGGGKPQ